MKEVVFIKAKILTLVFAQNQTFLHGKDNTFRSGNPTITERINQIPDKEALYGQTCQGFQHMESPCEYDILPICRLRIPP